MSPPVRLLGVVGLWLAGGGAWAATAPALPDVGDPVGAYLGRLFGAGPQAGATPAARCGLELEALIAEAWPRLSPHVRAGIPARWWPAGSAVSPDVALVDIEICDAWVDIGHFRVHYATASPYQPPGYPDLQTVHDLGSCLEAAYAYHRDVSGMGVPMPDGESGGGTDLIDCYFCAATSVAMGQARRGASAASGCGRSATGYIIVSTELSSDASYEDELHDVSAHEYYHLLQYAHGRTGTWWFMESTARASEFQVWPEHARARGYGEWAIHPWYSLWDGSGTQRYAPHFWFFLEARVDPWIVTRLWDRACAGEAEEPALRGELALHGADLDALTTEFAIWNYFTGERDDGRHYDPLYRLTSVYPSAVHDVLPVDPQRLPFGHYARPGGTNYISFPGPASRADLRLHVDGDPALADLRSLTVLARNRGSHRAWTLAPDGEGDADFVVPDWDQYDDVTLVVANFWGAPGDSARLDYTYEAVETDALSPAGEVAWVAAVPNPFHGDTRLVFALPAGAGAPVVHVYDLAGRLVRTLTDGRAFAGGHRLDWDGRDDGGRALAAGQYVVQVDHGGEVRSRKVTLVR